MIIKEKRSVIISVDPWLKIKFGRRGRRLEVERLR